LTSCAWDCPGNAGSPVVLSVSLEVVVPSVVPVVPVVPVAPVEPLVSAVEVPVPVLVSAVVKVTLESLESDPSLPMLAEAEPVVLTPSSLQPAPTNVAKMASAMLRVVAIRVVKSCRPFVRLRV
jgi:hypothetical protein